MNDVDVMNNDITIDQEDGCNIYRSYLTIIIL